MSKIANGNVVYSGWLVKSPPENKFRLSGPWKIFRSFSQDAMDTSKWKRRFFILFKPQGSLPHQYVLNYYNNEEGKKLKGYIDLEHCEQIIESLDLDLFPFLLAIKTYHKNRERTYFLAADTEEQMTSWVRNLCSVCGLKPEDNSSDLPPQREEDSDTFTTIQNVPSSIIKQPVTQPTQGITHVPQSRDRKNSDRDYVPLTNCRTGTVSRKPPLLRPDSVDSVPDEIAPPPPVKRGQVIEDDVFHSQVYDMPPRAHDMNVTMPAPKICTSSESSSRDDSTLDVYDVPPPGHPPRHSPSTPRSSSSESHKADSAYSSQSVLTYDYPPTSSEKNVVSDETYDYPPTNPHNLPKMDDVPPVRPPPPKSYLQQQEPYQNIPPNSKMLNEGIDSLDINKVVPMSTNLSANVPLSYDFPSNNAPTQSAYDFPTSGQSGSSLLVIPPPGCGIDSHSYINAATRPVSHAHEDMYLAMDGLVPPAVADRTSSISDSGKSHDSYTLMSELNVYDHPPPQRPPRTSKVIPKPCNGDAYTNIYKNERTRSFKKHNTINNPPFDSLSGRDPYTGKISRSLQHSVPLPKNPHPDLTTSSEDEDDERIADIDQVMVPYPYEEHQKSQNWNKVPPPMKMGDKHDKDELKYLELDLVDQPTSQPIHLTHAESGMNTPTEYREIDFIKTKALSEVKKTVEGQRKHDEN